MEVEMVEMNELIGAMSDNDLAELKVKYSDNPSVTTLIDGILEARQKEAVEHKAKDDFTKGITKLFAKLPHPEDVYNVFARWGEVEVEDTTQEAEEVEVVVTPAEVDKDGNITTEAVVEKQDRYPTTKAFQWIVEVNHATRVSSTTTGEPKVSKRAITVFKRNGTQLEAKGNYASASKACEALGLTIGGDSATRVLSRDGYISEPYDGTDFAS